MLENDGEGAPRGTTPETTAGGVASWRHRRRPVIGVELPGTAVVDVRRPEGVVVEVVARVHALLRHHVGEVRLDLGDPIYSFRWWWYWRPADAQAPLAWEHGQSSFYSGEGALERRALTPPLERLDTSASR